VWFENIIGFDDDYFLPRFDKELVKGKVCEWQMFGLAFDSYVILEYESVDDMLLYLKQDLKAMQKVLNRNKKRLMVRSDGNERKLMNVVCGIGTLADNYISDVEKHPENYQMPKN
jgi:hypothetical protein